MIINKKRKKEELGNINKILRINYYPKKLVRKIGNNMEFFRKKTLRNHQLQQLSFYTDYTHQTKSEYSTLVISGYSLGPQSNAVDVKEKIPKDSSSNLI